MRIALATLLVSLAVAIPVRAQPVYIPAQPMHLCQLARLPDGRHRFRVGWTCLPFDARRLLGLSVSEASALARHYGYSLRREQPLGEHEGLTADYNTGRIEVETDAPTTQSTVIRIIGRG